jgi:hypothetical protein
MFDGVPFVLHVTTDLGKSLEQILSPASVGTGSMPLGAAVLTADYAATDPGLIDRLREADVPFTVEPQSMRFATEAYLRTKRIAKLPYAPLAPLDPARWTDDHQRMVEGALRFQARVGVSHYMVPALPYEKPTPQRLNTYRAIHEEAVSLLGSADVPRKPILAMAVPGAETIRSPFAVFSLVSDRPFDGIYVQPMRLDPKSDSVEGLVRLMTFFEIGRQEGVRAIAGRVGMFGMVLNAAGVEAFDSGLGDHEAFDLRSLARPPKPGQKGGGGQRDRRAYFPKLMTTLDEPRARILLNSPAIRAQFACDLGRCRSGFESILAQSREHCFHSRAQDLAVLRGLPTAEMRMELVERRLRTAIETGRAVNRVLGEDGQRPANFDHLDRWLGALARVEERRLLEAS